MNVINEFARKHAETNQEDWWRLAAILRAAIDEGYYQPTNALDLAPKDYPRAWHFVERATYDAAIRFVEEQRKTVRLAIDSSQEASDEVQPELSSVQARRALRVSHGLSSRFFGCPVYLVGGAITDPDPRDIDLVIPVPERLFVAMYGSDGDLRDVDRAISAFCGGSCGDDQSIWNRWARDAAKVSRDLTFECGRAVDFKVQYQAEFDRHADKPRVKLSRELHVSGAASNSAV